MMTTYREDPENKNCILWVDGNTDGFVKKGKIRIDYRDDKEILDKDKNPTGEFEQIPVEVDVYQELLDKEEAGEITIQWITTAQRKAKIALDNQTKINTESLQLLKDTDWYITRQIETNKPTPEDIIIQRQLARDAITEIPV